MQLSDRKDIDNILPISLLLEEKKVISLFHSIEEDVNYSLYTDGTIELVEIRIDKWPHYCDDFLKTCGKVNKFNFKVSDANLLLIKKQYKDKKVKNLYIDLNNMYKVINYNLYQVSITEKENIKIKKVGNLFEN